MSEVVRHLTTEQALGIARAAVGGPVDVRDIGLLDAAVHRPQAEMFGVPAYDGLFEQAAALLHGLVTSHPLVDGNKRLGWLATWVILAKNDVVVEVDDDTAYDLVIDVAAGAERDVAAIAERLRAAPDRAEDVSVTGGPGQVRGGTDPPGAPCDTPCPS